MNDKEHRQRLIQNIVQDEVISTQAELVTRLGALRVQATQATVSRDICELHLVRIQSGKGRYRYALAPYSNPNDVKGEMQRLFHQWVRDVDRGENTVVLKTSESHAGAVAKLLDQWARDEIVGTLAGRDTVLVVARTVESAIKIENELAELLL